MFVYLNRPTDFIWRLPVDHGAMMLVRLWAELELEPQLTQESTRSSQRPSFVESRRPILNKRCMGSLKPHPQLLRVDRAQVLTGAGAQCTLKPNQIVCRTLAPLGGLRGPQSCSDHVLPECSHIGVKP